MILAPFYKVWVGTDQRDITDNVTSFDFEDCLDEDDYVKLGVYAPNMEFMDDSDFLSGNVIQYKFGFIGGAQSPIREAVIEDIDYNYGSILSMTLKCLDKGVQMKKNSVSTIWKKKTASQIVTDIAAKYKLKTNITPTKKVYEDYPQGNMSDFEFINQLAHIESGGDYQFFIKSNTLNFIKRDLSQASTRTFTYGKSENIVSFKPKVESVKNSGSVDQVKVPFVNAGDGQSDDQSVNDKNSKSKKLGNDSVSNYDPDGNLLPGTAPEVGKAIVVPAGDSDEAKNLAAKAKKDEELKGMTATLVIEMDPLILADEIITMSGTAIIHSGNWYVKKITHSIKPSSPALSTMSLMRNASNKPVKSGANEVPDADKNKDIGPESATQSKGLVRYSPDGRRLN